MTTTTKEKKKEAPMVGMKGEVAPETLVLKNKDLGNLYNATIAMMNAAVDLTGGALYAFERNIDKMESSLKAMDRRRFKDMICKHAILDKDGNPKLSEYPAFSEAELTEEEKADPAKLEAWNKKKMDYENGKAAFRAVYLYPSDEAKEACNKEIEDMLEEDCGIQFYKMKLEYFEGIKIHQEIDPVSKRPQPIPFTNLIVKFLVA